MRVAELGFQTSLLSDLLPVALAIIMLGMGLSLTGADFARVRRMPRPVLAGVAAQFLLLPALAVLVALVWVKLLAWPAAFATGLLLLACCPGGATSNALVHLARADTALSVTLTSLTSLASVLVTPATFLLATSLVLGEAERIHVGFVDMAILVGAIVVVPILVGMAARRRWPGMAERAQRPFRIASILLFGVLVVAIMVQHRADLVEVALQTAPATLALNLLALAGGYAAARLAGAPKTSSRAISIEVGFQNATLAITLALTQLGSPTIAVVPAFYSLMMFATGGVLAWAWSRNAVAERAAAPADDAMGADVGAR